MLYLNIDIEKEVNKFPLNERPVMITVDGVNIPRYSYNMIDMPKVEQSLQNGEYTFCNLINAVENEYYFTVRECFLKQIQEQGLSVNEQHKLLGECMVAFRSTSGGSGDMCHDFAVYRAAQIHNTELAALLCKGTISGIFDVYCLSADRGTLYLLDDGKDFDVCTFRTQYDIKEYSKQNIDVTACMFSELQYKYAELKKFNTFKEMANEVPLMCLHDYIQEMLWGFIGEDGGNTFLKITPTAAQYLRHEVHS